MASGFSLSDNERELLKENGWEIYDDFGNFGVVNKNTGCRIHGAYSVNFVRDKIEELSEEEFAIQYPLDEDLFKMNGYTVLSESPFEVADSFGFGVTGECALWLRGEFRKKYKRNLGNN